MALPSAQVRNLHVSFDTFHSLSPQSILNTFLEPVSPDITPFDSFSSGLLHSLLLPLASPCPLLAPSINLNPAFRHCTPLSVRALLPPGLFTSPLSPLLTVSQPHWPYHPDCLLHQGLCSWLLPPSPHPHVAVCLGGTFSFFMFQVTCHLFREVFPDYPI